MLNAKICGITRLEDALLAKALGAWALGFIFVESSPRKTSLQNAALISKGVGPSIEKVAVFQNEDISQVKAAIESGTFTLLQFHGGEDDEYLSQVKSITSLGIIQVIKEARPKVSDLADYVLFESENPDWERARTLKENCGKPMLIAGGIDEENVGKAIQMVGPFGVDLARGVESAPGIKSSEKLHRFFDKLRSP